MTDISGLNSLPAQGFAGLNPAERHWMNELTKLPAAIGAAGTGKEKLGTSEVNKQTGTAYTLQIEDAGRIVEMNNSSANTLTIPPFSDVPFPYGKDGDHARLSVVSMGSGTTTISPGAGVTIRSLGGNTDVSGQYGRAELYHRDEDEWVLSGDLS